MSGSAGKGTGTVRPGPWAIIEPVRGRIRFAMALSAASALCSLAMLVLLSLAVRDLIEIPGAPPIWPMAGAACCMVAAYLLRLSAFDRSHYAAFHLETVLRKQLIDHVSKVSLGDVQAFGTATLAKVMHDDVKALHVFVADSTPLYARAFVMPVATFILMLWLDWRLALAALSVVVIGFGIMGLAMRNFPDMARRYNEAREQVSIAIVEFVQAMPVVRTFDSGHTTFGRYQRALDAYLTVVTEWYRGASFTARFSMAVLGPLPTLVMLIAVGILLLQRGTLDFDVWLAVLLLGTGMAEAIMPMMSLNHLADKAKLSIARIRQVLELDEMPVPRPGQGYVPTDGSITFENVSFGYAGHGETALHDVSFHAQPGTVTALVGRSGAGKTTITRLIARFWDVSKGRVLIGGRDVRDMETDRLMAQVSLVFQDPFLLSGSIGDNIRLGSADAPMTSVIAAAKAACIHDFIMTLPNGYDTSVGERGHFLSGGQRQRITIARALLQNRPIVVLDEATAFSDPQTEAELLAAFAALKRGRTVIMVAHRLSAIRTADQILMLDKGRIIERGTHEELIEKAGRYARLWIDHDRARSFTLADGEACP